MITMSKKKSKKDRIEEEKKKLKGLDIKINEFGEIITSYSVDKVNDFLNENVDDKKLKDRDDLKDEEE